MVWQKKSLQIQFDLSKVLILPLTLARRLLPRPWLFLTSPSIVSLFGNFGFLRGIHTFVSRHYVNENQSYLRDLTEKYEKCLKMPKRMVICPRASSNSVKSQLEMSTLSWNSARPRSTLSFFKFNGNLCHAEKTPWRSQFRTTEKIGPWSRTSPELGVVSIGLDLGRSRKATKMPMASHEVMGNPGFLDNREEAPTIAWSGMEGRRVTRQQ